jgi:uncharacterized SAM-binding protein YcdF (DUF218 family)
MTWRRPALLCLAAWPLAAWAGAWALVARDDPQRADAIVVFSGSVDYAERAEHAARLYGEGRARRVILTNDGGRSGWSSEQQRNPLFVERAAEVLRRAGVPAENIEAPAQTVEGTYAEAVFVKEYAAGRGFRSLIFVTSWYHSRRARWTIRRVYSDGAIAAGLDAAPAGSPTRLATWWLRPEGWRTAAAEYPKLVYYWLRYG